MPYWSSAGEVRLAPVLVESQTVQPLGPEALLALAYLAGAQVIDRYAAGDPDAQDVPIGAVAYDLSTHKAYTGYPRDRELGDRTAHAERQAHEKAQADGAASEHLHFLTTFEPCPDCFVWMADVRAAGVTYVIGRQALEAQGLVKPHALKAPDIAKMGRTPGKPPYPELAQVPDAAWQAACLALFSRFNRNPTTERVQYDPGANAVPLPDLSDFVRNSEHIPHNTTLTEAGLYIARFFAPVGRSMQ